jgi:flagellar motor switch protein FliN
MSTASKQAEEQADQSAADGNEGHLARILAMKIPVIVKITEKEMPLEKILKLSIGSMIQFDKDAYQHIDLMINNTTVGFGQPVKVGENFGLKIVQIGDIAKTIKSLGGEEE